MTSIVVIGSHLHTVAATIASYIDRVWGGAYSRGACACHPSFPPLKVNFFVLIFNVEKIMLKFEHFRKCTPEMYPWAPPFQISKYATGRVLAEHNIRSKTYTTYR